MNIDQILRRGDKMAAETAAVIRRGEELVAKLESGDVKPEDPQVKEILFQLKERVRIKASLYHYLPQPSIRAAGFAVAGPAGLLPKHPKVVPR